MQARNPHFLLFSGTTHCSNHREKWRFVLQSVNGSQQISATDAETDTHGSRLELLAVVRGLEALNQPSQVTLVTKSRYVSRGMRRGLSQWRERNWQWERFGKQVPIRDHDLWERVDRAMQFHQVKCCPWVFESPEAPSANGSCATVPEIDGPRRRPSKPSFAPVLQVEKKNGRTAPRQQPRFSWPLRAAIRLIQRLLAPGQNSWQPMLTRAT